MTGTLFPEPDAHGARHGADDATPGGSDVPAPQGPTGPPGAPGVCPVCRGCGLVSPSPFDGPPAPWSEYVAWVAAQLTGGLPWGGSAAAAGLTRPLPCPDCDGSAPLPAAVLIPDFLEGGS